MKPISKLLFAATPLLSAAIGFFTVPLLTWSMPPQVIAQFGLFQYASSAFLIIVTCGFDQAFLRELAGQSDPTGLLRKALLPCLALLGIFSVFALWWSSNAQAVNIFGQDAYWLIPLLVAVVIFLTLHRFGTQQTRMNPSGGLAFFMSELALRSPLIILLLILAINPKEGLEHMPFVAVAIGAVLSSVVIIAANIKTWKGLTSRSNCNSKIKSLELFKFGFPLALASIFYWGISNTGPYITQALHGSEDTAILIVAISIANIAVIGQSMFSLLWLPVVYKKMETGLSAEDIELAARRVCAGSVIFFISVMIIIYILQNFLGSNYRNIAPIATVLCVLPILYTISEVTFVGLMQIRKTGVALIATTLALIFSIIANSVLIPLFGIIGAASATSIAAFGFLMCRTELSCKFWRPIKRRIIYFGSVSILIAGLSAPWFPANVGPVAALILIPYLYFERKFMQVMLKDIKFFIIRNYVNKIK